MTESMAIPIPKPASRALVLRTAVVGWLAVYVPVYASAYGGWHFLQLCDLGLLLACLGLLTGNRLLISAQALGAPAIGLVWLADLSSRLVTGHYLNGATAYLWDAAIPLAARVLSVFHLVLPMVLVGQLARHGYDRRALALQAAIAALVLAVSALGLNGAGNLNYVAAWPDGRVLFGNPVAHVVASWLLLCVAVYAPTHVLWRHLFGSRFALGKGGIA